jgi:hypothetical protein
VWNVADLNQTLGLVALFGMGFACITALSASPTRQEAQQPRMTA